MFILSYIRALLKLNRAVLQRNILFFDRSVKPNFFPDIFLNCYVFPVPSLLPSNSLGSAPVIKKTWSDFTSSSNRSPFVTTISCNTFCRTFFVGAVAWFSRELLLKPFLKTVGWDCNIVSVYLGSFEESLEYSLIKFYLGDSLSSHQKLLHLLFLLISLIFLLNFF